MPYRQLVTIPLSTGFTGTTWHLSVAYVPRLHEAGKLSDYDLDWAQWPAIAAALSVNIFVNNAPTPINPARITTVSPAPSLDVWEALFGPATKSDQPVAPYRFIDRRQPDFREFPSAEVVDGLKELYLAVSDEFPEVPPTPAEVLDMIEAEFLRNSTLQAADDYLAPTADPPIVPTEGPGLEFHELMTVLRAHPHLLRLLGLVVDFEVQLQAGAPLPGRVRVNTNWAALTGAAARDQCPLALNLDGDLWPRPLFPDEHVAAYLKLSDASRYKMATTDVVSAAQRLFDYQQTTLVTGTAAPVPAPREAGVTVVHTDLSDLLDRRFERQRRARAPDRPLVHGTHESAAADRAGGRGIGLPLRRLRRHRQRVAVGVRARTPSTATSSHATRRSTSCPPTTRAGGHWHWRPRATSATCPGRRTWSTPRKSEPNVRKTEADDQTRWRLPVAAFRWNGWSAAAPQPGSSLNGSGDAVPRADNVGTADQQALLEVNYSPVLGTLPRLRYGRTYTVRARATDLAGNSKTVDEIAPADALSTPVTFRRTQPVEPPLPIRTVPKAVPGVGDTSATLVIKSEQDQPFEEIASTGRHLYPPRIAQATTRAARPSRWRHRPRAPIASWSSAMPSDSTIRSVSTR